MKIGNVLIRGKQGLIQSVLIAGIGIQKMKQIIKQTDKARKNNGKDHETVKPACEKLYIMRIVDQHVQQSEKRCGGKGHPVGNLHQIHPAVYVPVKEKHQKEKDKSKDIARLHAGRLHQGPGADKALKQMRQ